MNELFDLADRLAVVTGALGRLGPVWTEALLGAGAVVVGIDRLEPASGSRFCALQEQFGPRRLLFFRADIQDRAELEAARDHLLAQQGAPWVLVNNAGVDQPPSSDAPQFRLEELPQGAFKAILDVNVWGTFQVTQVFGPPMAAAGRGSIINIGSLYASVAPDQRFYEHLRHDPPFLKPPAYGASKAAVVNLTKYLAALWGPCGVRVNTLSPGGVLGDQDETFRRKFCERVPLGRMAAADDLSGPLLFLASDASRYVTGVELRVDGGYTAW